MLNEIDARNLMQMVGVPESELPEGFEQEYKLRLSMQHKFYPGAMQIPVMIDLCRTFDLGPQLRAEAEPQTNWSAIPLNTPVSFTPMDSSTPRDGVYLGKVSSGCISVMPEGGSNAVEISPLRVKPREVEKPPQRDTIPGAEKKEVRWSELAVGTPVKAGKGKKERVGKLKSYHAANEGSSRIPEHIKIEFDGNVEVCKVDEVQLV